MISNDKDIRSCVHSSATMQRSCNRTNGLVGVEAHISAMRAWCLAARVGAVVLVVLVVEGGGILLALIFFDFFFFLSFPSFFPLQKTELLGRKEKKKQVRTDGGMGMVKLGSPDGSGC